MATAPYPKRPHNQQRQHGSGSNRQNNHHQQRSDGPSAITAPYNFVPLSSQVFQPGWFDKVSIDQPMEKGLCGTLDFTVTAHSPLLVGGKLHEAEPVHPYQLPDDHYAIPGSTLRGMLRSVLEIASFGKMQLVDDKRYGVRDLTPGARQFYGSKLSESKKGMGFRPKSQAGWLQFTGGDWQITPCDFARIEHRELRRFSKGSWIPAELKLAEEKYYSWLKSEKSLVVNFTPEDFDYHPHSKGKKLGYRKVSDFGRGQTKGTVIFTGQPSPTKHLEFVFFGENQKVKTVPERVMQGFLQIYRDTDHWKTLRKMQADFQQGIPVFYLEERGAISSLGLSLMYKLAYRNSVGEVVANTQTAIASYQDKKQREYKRPDLAELIFGFVDELDGEQSLKSRVSIAHARCEQAPDTVETRTHTTILNGPKPTYYPNYIEQQQENGQLTGEGYATFMDEKARIRGWKRYPVRSDSHVPRMTHDQAKNKKIQVELHPLIPKPELVFNSRLRFHNLTPEELGALIWVMEWGGNQDLYHNAGMAKAFGFGRVNLRITPEQVDIQPNDFSPAKAFTEYRDLFIACMDGFCGGDNRWQSSEQMIQLLAMANPGNAPGQPGGLEHLDLAGGGRNNEFVLAKKAKLVLQPYAVSTGSGVGGVQSGDNGSAWDDSPAGQWLQAAVETIAAATRTPEEKVLHAKGLAKEWSGLEDGELKAAVLVLIKAYWVRNDWWDEPVGKSTQIAHKIYSGS